MRLFMLSIVLVAFASSGDISAQTRNDAFGRVTPPTQPATGPGGAAAISTVRQSTFDSGDKQYWVFEPEQVLGPVPVIAFLHGWGLMTPEPYLIWIEHLVKRGNIVVYPRYQDDLKELTPNMAPNALSALLSAFARLGNRADRNRFAIIGHSIGASLAFDLSGLAASSGLPAPKALMSVAPGGTTSFGSLGSFAEEGQSAQDIPAGVLALVLIGDEDITVGDETAKLLFASMPQVPCANKNLVLVQSDRHGIPPLLANHSAGMAPLKRGTGGVTDALDYYGYWKLSDALIEAAFYGTSREYALGGGPKQLSMGAWSDGRPVAPLQIVNDGTCGAP
jgi:acetyl esterase/lipase